MTRTFKVWQKADRWPA